jgi:hypothetical protein
VAVAVAVQAALVDWEVLVVEVVVGVVRGILPVQAHQVKEMLVEQEVHPMMVAEEAEVEQEMLAKPHHQ